MPDKKTHGGTAKDFFMHLLSIVTLYMGAAALVTLLFQYVNYFFPDPVSGRFVSSLNGAMRFAVSTLIVVLPVYLWSMRTLHRQYAADPKKWGLRVRKWLTYFTLFAAGCIIIGDLIALLNSFLSGELSVRFLLKTLSLLLVAMLVFSYYLQYEREQLTHTIRRIYQIAVSALVLGLVIAAFFVMTSPAEARRERLDRERVNDLQHISSMVERYWREEGQLPEQLSVLEDRAVYGQIPTDPDTGESYTYTMLEQRRYELCAIFVSDNTENEQYSNYYPFGAWQHDVGKECFDLTVQEREMSQKPRPLID